MHSSFLSIRSIRFLSSFRRHIGRKMADSVATQEGPVLNGAVPKPGSDKPKGSGDAKPKKSKEAKENQAGSASVELNPRPQYIDDRIKLWDKFKIQYDAELAAKLPEPIQVTLPDGKVVEAKSWRTTPYEIAAGISQGLADNAVISRVNGELWDLDRPLESSCKVELLKFESEDGQQVFWHSSAHILG
jgi:threonyl-tRNA synthetase